ncbi:MAG: Uncharacterized protein TM_0518, partial [Olavius algarvensis Delta 4 endosymbiont]
WIVTKRRTCKIATAPMNPAPAKVTAANACAIIWTCGSCPAVASRRLPRPPGIGPLIILRGWCKTARF